MAARRRALSLFGTLRRQLALGMALVVLVTMGAFVWNATLRERVMLLDPQGRVLARTDPRRIGQTLPDLPAPRTGGSCRARPTWSMP